MSGKWYSARMRRALVAVALSGAAWLGAAPAHADEAILVDKVAALVGGVAILRSDVLATARSAMPRPAKDASELARVEKQALELLIDNALIVRDALRRGLQVSDLEVAQAKERVAQNVGRPYEALLDQARRNGVTARDYDGALRAEILMQKWLILVVKPRVKAPATPEAMVDPESTYAKELAAERGRAVAELRKWTLVQVR